MIKTESLTYSYPDGTEAVTGIDLHVRQGEFIALMGVNGSGKTTLLKLLIGLLKPCSGKIFIDGKDLSTLKDQDIFQRVGMLFQDPNDQLFASTVEEDVAFGALNVGMTRSEASLVVTNVLSRLGIAHLKDRAIHTLSFGQKRRVALAGVLAMKPGIILLDEPTGGLDPLSVTPIMALLKRFNRQNGIVMIMATHDVDLVPIYCDRMIIMDHGRAVAQDIPSKILGDPALTRQVSLRLPRVTHLMEILQKEDNLKVDTLPLTIGQARRELLKLKLSGADNAIETGKRR
jgi:cobalt/nickel transport system ATP-binding protein